MSQDTKKTGELKGLFKEIKGLSKQEILDDLEAIKIKVKYFPDHDKEYMKQLLQPSEDYLDNVPGPYLRSLLELQRKHVIKLKDDLHVKQFQSALLVKLNEELDQTTSEYESGDATRTSQTLNDSIASLREEFVKINSNNAELASKIAMFTELEKEICQKDRRVDELTMQCSLLNTTNQALMEAQDAYTCLNGKEAEERIQKQYSDLELLHSQRMELLETKRKEKRLEIVALNASAEALAKSMADVAAELDHLSAACPDLILKTGAIKAKAALQSDRERSIDERSSHHIEELSLGEERRRRLQQKMEALKQLGSTTSLRGVDGEKSLQQVEAEINTLMRENRVRARKYSRFLYEFDDKVNQRDQIRTEVNGANSVVNKLKESIQSLARQSDACRNDSKRVLKRKQKLDAFNPRESNKQLELAVLSLQQELALLQQSCEPGVSPGSGHPALISLEAGSGELQREISGDGPGAGELGGKSEKVSEREQGKMRSKGSPPTSPPMPSLSARERRHARAETPPRSTSPVVAADPGEQEEASALSQSQAKIKSKSGKAKKAAKKTPGMSVVPPVQLSAPLSTGNNNNQRELSPAEEKVTPPKEKEKQPEKPSAPKPKKRKRI